jgi:hypothetical protein
METEGFVTVYAHYGGNYHGNWQMINGFRFSERRIVGRSLGRTQALALSYG